MSSSDLILIFAKPQLYFFPHYHNMIFAPFNIPQPGFRYLLYKAMAVFHLPCRSIFWGEWKVRVKTAKQVVIFDYGYLPHMEYYIHRINPDCQIYLFFWNRINPYNQKHLKFSDHDAIFSTDPGDCRKYGLRYNHIFYPKDFFTPYVPPAGQNKLFFLGVDKGRAPYISALKPFMENNDIICDIRIIAAAADPDYRKRFHHILTDRKLSYDEYLTQLTDCNILLDINQAGQSALTMRVMESIYLSKKLVTNNQSISSYDFYDTNNIFLLPEEGLPSAEKLQDFLKKPFKPYSDNILNNYSFEHWAAQFTKGSS